MKESKNEELEKVSEEIKSRVSSSEDNVVSCLQLTRLILSNSRAVFRHFKNKISVLTWMLWLMKNSFDWHVIKVDCTVINHFIHHQTYCVHSEKSLEKKAWRAL